MAKIEFGERSWSVEIPGLPPSGKELADYTKRIKINRGLQKGVYMQIPDAVIHKKAWESARSQMFSDLLER